MKKLALPALIVILSACEPSNTLENAQNIPDNVQTAFNQRHPGISPTWEVQPSYGYEATFSENGIEYEVEFASDGTWLETEYEVTDDLQFPPVIFSRVQQKYPDYTITKREIELTPQGTFYELEVERGGTEIELYFNDRAIEVPNSNEDI
ncbi:MAG: PepSY-like domain-containing protein [Cyanobacteriota bacterium]|nr:PepSY-like domain-containing protein [Cyanobacteriota bacterium]